MSSTGSASFIVRDGVSDRVKALAQFVIKGDKGVMREAADTVRQEIHNRTATGRDIDGQPFAPYAKSTLRKAAYQGKRVPDLDLTGRMLESIHKQVLSGFSARLFFNGSHGGIGNSLLARVHHHGMRSGRGAGFAMPRRAFFGLTTQQRARVTEHLHKVITDKARRIWGKGGR